jgi:hypothetical protein
MKIRIKKKLQRGSLILGVSYLFLTLLKIILSEKAHWSDFGFILVSLLFFVQFLYNTKYPYLNIENGIILINGPLGKKVTVDDIEYVRTFYGDYIFQTKSKELTISTEHLEASSKKSLQLKLEELGVKVV